MKHLEKLTRKRLGEILVDEGLISKAQIADAEREEKRTGESLGSILVEASYLTDWDLAKAVATQYQLPFIQLHQFPATKGLEELFPEGELRRRRFVPLDRIGNILTLAVAEMPDIDFLHDLRERHQVTPFLFVARMGEIVERIEGVPVESKSAPAAGMGRSMAAAPEPKPAPSREASVYMPPDASAEAIEGLEAFDRILPDDSDPLRPPTHTGETEPRHDETEPGPDESDGSWENIFDIANESILNEMDKE